MGKTPQFCAVACGQPEVVELLLDKGADVNAWNNVGLTPHAARRNRKDEALAALQTIETQDE